MGGCTASLARVFLLASAVFSVAEGAHGSDRAPSDPGSRLEVTVLDDGGEPVAGAVVVAGSASGRGPDPDKVRVTVTDSRGRATLESLPTGPWTVLVQARGWAPKVSRRVAAASLDVRLDRGGVITGIVSDGEGVPLAEARVSLDTGSPLPDAWAEEARRVESATDAEGRFRLEGIGPRPVTVVARAPGFGRAARENVEAGSHVELFLFPGATLEGAVVDEDGQPVAGALVQAAGGGLFSKSPPSERTDAEGAFVMAGVEEGEYVVMAREGAQAPGLARVVIEGEGVAFVEVALTGGGFAVGRVVDVSGEPLAGRVEAVTFEGIGIPRFSRDRFRTEAREDGTFVLGPLPLGLFELEAFVPGHAAERVEARVNEVGATVDLGDVVVDRGGRIRGRVLDHEGAAVAGALVSAWPRSGPPRHRPEAHSREDGSFEVGGLDEGRYSLAASKEGYAEAQAQVQAGDEAVELVLEAGGEVVGRVVDADGRPAPDARIRAERADGESGPGRGPRPSAFATAEDEEGHFVLRDAGVGTWVLRAEAPGRGEATVPGVRVAGGRTTDVGTLRLARGGVIRGVVLDAEGAGVPGATVEAERDTRSRTGRLATQSGGGGSFEIRGVPAGRFAVLARHPAFAPGEPVVVEVDPALAPEPMRVVLTRGGRIEGTVLHRDGRPFEGGRVMAQTLGPRRVGGLSESAAISPDGWYRLDHVAAGRTRVQLMAFTSRSPTASGGPANILTSVASRDLEIRNGETSTVDFPLRDVLVAGEVTRGGRPAPMIQVGLMGGGGMTMHFAGANAPRAALAASGPQPLTGTTGEDGRYELLVFSPGAFQALLTDLSGGQAHPPRQVDVPDAPVFELDLEIADTLVSGVLVDAETGEPAPNGFVRLRKLGPDGAWAGGGPAGADGRFSIPVEPGEYRLIAQAPGRRSVAREVSVGPAGLEDLRLEMEPGLEVRGRVLDDAGRPVGGISVAATDAEGGPSGMIRSLPDGTFRFDGLDDRPCTLATGTALAGFAIRPGVQPGGEPLTLRLRPGGRVALRVLDAAGQAVKDAWPRVRAVGGARVHLSDARSGPTNAAGTTELSAPAGAVEVEVRVEKQRGTGIAQVRVGEVASLEIVLKPTEASTSP